MANPSSSRSGLRAVGVFIVCVAPAVLGVSSVGGVYFYRTKVAMNGVCELFEHSRTRGLENDPKPEDKNGVKNDLRIKLIELFTRPEINAALQESCGNGVHSTKETATGEPDDSTGNTAAENGTPGNTQTTQPRGDRVRPLWSKVVPGQIANLVGVLFLALLPFLIIAGQMTRDAWARRKETTFSLEYARRSFWMKFAVAVVTCWGWLYCFNVDGIALGTVQTFINDSDVFGSIALPMQLSQSFRLRPPHLAFIGWFLYFVSYMFYRARRNDIRSARVYGVLLRKLLFALSVGIVLAIDSGSISACLVALLVGYIPASATQFLKDYGAKVSGENRASGGSLTELPAVSTWEVARLEEEGVDSLTSLLTKPRELLRESLPLADETVDLWYDIAALMTVVGIDRYQKLRNVCQTASRFVQESKDPAFVVRVESEVGIKNSFEIAAILIKTFGTGSPANLAL